MSPDPDPCTIAENDRLRSDHVRQLLQARSSLDVSRAAPSRIPKTLVQFWDQPDSIPRDVHECLASWKPLTDDGFQRVLFNDHSARSFITTQLGQAYGTAFNLCGHPAMRCDYFRLCYLFRNGGFYVDADELYQGGDCRWLLADDQLKVQPLCYDSSNDTMVSPDVFLRCASSFPDWIFYVNNNPIVAPPFHPIIGLALARSTRILLTRSTRELDIQSSTGPGNLTASLVRYSIVAKRRGNRPGFVFIDNWQAISISCWPLNYRDDERNWRNWDPHPAD